MTSRHLRTSAFSSREDLADALQSIFVSELLAPSSPLYLVTPWISDVPLLDNRTGRFAGLLPGLPARWIRMAELLGHQLVRGGSLVVACRPDAHNEAFTANLRTRAEDLGYSTLYVPDHFVDHPLAPIPTIAARPACRPRACSRAWRRWAVSPPASRIRIWVA